MIPWCCQHTSRFKQKGIKKKGGKKGGGGEEKAQNVEFLLFAF